MPIIDIVGKRYGRLTILEFVRYDKRNEDTYWKCECDCGNKKIISKRYLRGGTKSCGCLSRELASKRWKSSNKFEKQGNHMVGYTNNNVKFYFDTEDFETVKKYCWHITSAGYIATRIYSKDNKKSKIILMHRMLLNYPKDATDHINKDTTDNRKHNLRDVSDSDNKINHRLYINNTSGYNGVTFNKRLNKWVAQLRYKNKNHYLGCYKSISDAVLARKNGEKKLLPNFLWEQNNVNS